MVGKDFISEIRERQTAVADAISRELIALLDAALWFPLAVTEEVDADTARLFVTKEVEHQVLKCVHGYTDWAATGIIRSKRFGDRPFPIPDAEEAAGIAEKYDAKAPILRYVADRLARSEAVPLLGAVRDGKLIPDKKTLKEWASFYDWSGRETGGA